MERLLQDVRFAFRSLLRSRGFTAVALLTLALGIGANTAMFSVVYGVLLRPLPYTDADRLVRLYQANPSQNLQGSLLALPDIEDWQERTRSFSAIGASIRQLVVFTEPGEAMETEVTFVTEDFFTALATRPRLGEPVSADDVKQAKWVAVISDRLWKSRFSARPDVVGTTLRLTGRLYTIVGVMGPDFRYPTPDTDVWTPQTLLTQGLEINRQRGGRMWEGIARLKDGVTPEQARAELNVVSGQLAAEHPQTNEGWTTADAVPLQEAIVGDIDTALMVVLGAVGFTLLIGCVNLANLLLARGAARAGEIAIRTALGANRIRLIRQILTESVVLSLVGGSLGILLAVWGTQALMALSADTLPRLDDVHVDGRVIAFGILLSVLTGLLFGLLPAMRVAADSPTEHLRGGRGAVGSGQRMRSGLVVAEVALAVILAIGAGLMARSFLALRGVEKGFDPSRVLAVTLRFNLSDRPAARGAQLTPDAIRNIMGRLTTRRDDLLERLAALPGVEAVGAINGLPLRDGVPQGWEIERADGSRSANDRPLRVDSNVVSAGYLRAMGITLRRGEPLPERIAPGAPPPVLVNETLARTLWPDQDPVGRAIRPAGAGGGGVAFTVIGVVGDVRQHGLAHSPVPVVYLPQSAAGPNIVTTYLLRTTGDPVALTGAVRNAVLAQNRSQPIRSISTLSDVMAESIARDRFFTVLFQIFGGLALVLAAVGIYGVIAYTVGQRAKEIGVRISLGARGVDVLRMVVGGGLRPVLIGLAIGIVASVGLANLLASQLFGIEVTDLATFVAAPAILTVVALLACYIPARTATRIDPIVILRDR